MLLAERSALGALMTARGDHAHAQNVRDEERVVSVLAGGVAVGLGLASRSWLGGVGALLGGGLLYRGVTGHCHVYQALGVGNEPRERTLLAHEHPIGVARVVTIQKPRSEVYAAACRTDVLAHVLSHFAVVAPQGPEALQWTVHDPLGRAHSWQTRVVTTDEEVRVESEPDALMAYRSTLTLTAAPGERGTEARLALELYPRSLLARALGKLALPAPALIAQRMLFNLKAVLEAGELPSLHHNPAAR